MKGLDEINDLKKEILEAMIENENTEEEIEQRFMMRQLKRIDNRIVKSRKR